jgi:hypothetical protein
MRSATARVRAELLKRLQGDRLEIERAILTRAHAVADPTEVSDPRYADGLRASICAAIDYGLSGIAEGETYSSEIPPVLLAQARIAARNGVSLDVVLRRYLAGYTLLSDHLMSTVHDESGITGTALQRLMRDQAMLLDRLLAKISEEHTDETTRKSITSSQRSAERIKRLLDGELIDTSDFNYPFDSFHLGVIAVGTDSAEAIRSLAAALDCRLLSVQREEGTVWAWLGGRCMAGPADVESLVSSDWPSNAILAVGEPGKGLDGWRLTHRQASAALSVALRRSQVFTRYADVALLATMLQDDLLAVSLSQLYLAPLARKRDGGKTARETLRAYFAANRNVSSAAAALGLSRRAVAKRLRTIEAELGFPLDPATSAIEAALRFEELAGDRVARGQSHPDG